MTLKCREELVGKRFLSVRSHGKLKLSKITDWEWRSGVIRAVSPTHRDITSSDLTILVEFDDRDWQKREWIKVHHLYQVFLVEHTLVWLQQPDSSQSPSHLTWPALVFKPIVDKVGLSHTKKKPVEFLLDRDLSLVDDKELSYYQEGEENTRESALQDPDVRNAVKAWVDYQDGQKILLTTPTVLVGYRVEVYRAEGTTQWYTAVIHSYNHSTKTLAVTDDTVLEHHNEDPTLTQMRLIDDGVVDSILRGVEVGIVPRRRPRTNNNNNSSNSKEQVHRRPTHGSSTPTNSQQTTPPVSRSSTGTRTSKSRQKNVEQHPEKVAAADRVNSSRSRSQASRDRKRKSYVDTEDCQQCVSPGKQQKGSDDPEYTILPEPPDPEEVSNKDTLKVQEKDVTKETRSREKAKTRRSKNNSKDTFKHIANITSGNKVSNNPVHKDKHKESKANSKVKETSTRSRATEKLKLKSEKTKLNQSGKQHESQLSSKNELNEGEKSGEVTQKALKTETDSTEEGDDNMHFKKQILLSGGNNSGRSSDSQPASLTNIDVTRSITDQITKAKADKLALNCDGKPSESEAASHISTFFGDQSDINVSKPQALSPDRHRDNLIGNTQTQINTGIVRSNTPTPGTEDRSYSRGSDDRSFCGFYDDKKPSSRPSSRLDEVRSVKSSPASSPLIVDKNEPVHIYRDPELMRKNPVQSNVQNILEHQQKTMSQSSYPSVHNPIPTAPPTVIPTTASMSHPISRTLLTPLPYPHSLPPSMSTISHQLSLPHPGYASDIAARGLVAQQQQQQQLALQHYQNAQLMQQLSYSHAGNRLAQLELLWQQKFPTVPLPPPYLLAKQQEGLLGDVSMLREREIMERERAEQRDRLVERAELERIEREHIERERRERDRKDRMEREKAEREKADRERQDREKVERERVEKERQERERERAERELQDRLEREREQSRHERERILHESSTDSLAAVDQHFTESLRLASQRDMERERELQHEMSRHTEEKRYLQQQESYKQQRLIHEAHQKAMEHSQKDTKVEAPKVTLSDMNKSDYYPYSYPGVGYPSQPDKQTIFNLYGYPSPHSSVITTEQLQQRGLVPSKHIKEEKTEVKGLVPTPAHTGSAHLLSRNKEIPLAHTNIKKEKTPSSVIVENKTSVKTENTVNAQYGNPVSISSSPRPQPRPAHTPEQRLDRTTSPASGIPHHLLSHTLCNSPPGRPLHQSHPTAFRTMESNSASRSQSPHMTTSQQAQSVSLAQPVDYCKSNTRLKATTGSSPLPSSSASGHTSTAYPAIAQPPVSLPPSSLSYSYSLIQQGLVPNPIYSHSSAQSMAKPATVQMSRTGAANVQNSTLPGANLSGQDTSSGMNVHSALMEAGQKRKPNTDSKGRKRQKPQNETPPTTTGSILHIPVTTPQILTNPSPYTTTSSNNYTKNSAPITTSNGPTTSTVTALLNTSPISRKAGSGFMDSFRSFVENTVQIAFFQDDKKAAAESSRNTVIQNDASSPANSANKNPPETVEKVEVSSPQEQHLVTPLIPSPPLSSLTLPQPPNTVNEDTSSSVMTNCSTVSSNNMASIMDTINRVANGQVDTDSDTLSAPSPPPSSKSDNSPLQRSGNHPKLKKAWLQRHSDEDKELKNVSCSEDSNPVSNVKTSLKGSVDSASEGCASPASSLPNGNLTDLSHVDDESTSSASETESRVTENSLQSKKRVKSKRPNHTTAKKCKIEESTSVNRKKAVTKKNKIESSKEVTKDVKEVVKLKEENPIKKEEKPKNNTKQQSSDNSPQPSNNKKPSLPASQPESPASDKTSQAMLTSQKDKKKSRRNKDTAKEPSAENKNGASSFNKPLVKMTVATLKKTCQPFIQDASCTEITPKLMKCRECKMTPTQRSKKLPNIFCRFYAFRRLRYSAKGVVSIAGFSELSDAELDDIEPWLPKTPVQAPALDIETAKFIIMRVGDKFCELVQQEKEAKNWAGEEAKIAWKRAVTGVREMCDVCDTTLFNMHWVCHKCGFVVCLDCYKVKVKTTKEGKSDDHKWLTCSANRQSHEAEKLMLTQIIPSDALWELGRMIHDIRTKWHIPTKCPCAQGLEVKVLSKNGMSQQILGNISSSKKLVNGIGEEHHGRSSKSRKRTHDSSDLNGKAVVENYNPDTTTSPLSLLADVAFMDSENSRDRSDSPFSRKKDSDKSKSNNVTSEEMMEVDDKKTPASCSTLRELLTKTAGKVKVQNETKKSKSKNTGSTLDDIIQSVVEKSCRDNDFKFLHYRPRLGGWTRDLPIMVHNLTETSVMYPDVPHSWLCDGRLLRLHDSRHKGNLKIFQEQWRRGQPVLVSSVDKCTNRSLWKPELFGKEFGHIENDLVNTRTGNVIVGHPMEDFWDGFECLKNRPTDEDDEPMLLKLKDWPPGDDFSDLMPSRFQDMMQALPLPEYTQRQGVLNLASRLPDFLVKPDLGPKMYNAYGSSYFPSEGTTNLHLDISDAVNVMVYVGIPEDGPGGRAAHEQAALKAIDDAGCDTVTKRRVREVHEIPGALWQIYDAHDADKIRDFLNKVAKERGEVIEPDHDPIHDQSWYLDEELRERVYQEYGVVGYTIVQCLGDSIFIPAGAPHQVRNLHSCIKVAEDFVSPEHLNHCFRLTQEFRQLSDTHSNHEDKLQVKNIIYHAVKDAIAVLKEADPEDE
ncbi:lysine-specific demethylase 3B-like isoform X2 [Gigantopelta aegis]|uniref:lysine-specific demethylase 3B-like isoform X2 n=1 Tax=Gigantopelta aegis TaxID=1735272 RepID=UPI001B8878C6|nr:lysine-specific demethylase 3B-like isoform X2 [Gigantopelta aegis]